MKVLYVGTESLALLAYEGNLLAGRISGWFFIPFKDTPQFGYYVRSDDVVTITDEELEHLICVFTD